MADAVPRAALEHVFALLDRARGPAAAAEARRLTESHPASAEAWDTLRVALWRTGDRAGALAAARRAAELAPGNPGVALDLGLVESAMGLLPEAAATLSRAVEMQDGAATDAPAWANLCAVLLALDRLADVERRARQGLARFPGDKGLVLRLASALAEQGRANEAVAALGAALFADPADASLALAAAAISNYASPAKPLRTLAAAKNHARLLDLAARVTPLAAPRPAAATPRGLRVAFLSSDLCTHSVGYFFEAALEGWVSTWADGAGPSAGAPPGAPLLFMTGPRRDDAGGRMRRAAEAAGGVWIDAHAMDDATLARAIHRERADLVVELNGLTAGNRLAALRHRPAPVQATWLGYPGSTGCPWIDRRIVDETTDPPGAEAHCTERLARMAGPFLCYRPPADAPPVAQRGADQAITFGSFNALMKVNDDVARLWAAVLAQVPGSRLLLKAGALRDETTRHAVAARLARAGLDPARLELRGPTGDVPAHLAAYADVDIALDTHPYHGTTTTCEALWMGVPVVTLAAPDLAAPHAARVGRTLLRAVGLEELAAPDSAAFVAAAAALAADAPRRAELRRTLRARMAASPLCDVRGFGARFADVLQRIAQGAP